MSIDLGAPAVNIDLRDARERLQGMVLIFETIDRSDDSEVSRSQLHALYVLAEGLEADLFQQVRQAETQARIKGLH